MELDELIGHFGLGKLTQQEALSRRLVAMQREGQAVQNRKGAWGVVTRMGSTDLMRKGSMMVWKGCMGVP